MAEGASGDQVAVSAHEDACARLLEPLRETAATNLLKTIVPPYKRLRAKHGALLAYAEQLRFRNNVLVSEVGTLQEVTARLQDEVDDVSRQRFETQSALEKLQGEHGVCCAELVDVRSTLANLVQEHDHLDKRYQLVSAAVAATPEDSRKFNAFTKILHEEFMPFANDEAVLKNEAEAVMRLKVIEDQLRVIESLSRFNNKTVVAVSGGFSSGKSTFINSLFQTRDIRLPVGIEPMTAIPTYVCHGESAKIVGCTAKGGAVTISGDVYGQLTHAFVGEFGFNLRDLVPFVAIEAPLKGLEEMAFIDLPGYDPGNGEGYTDGDAGVASEFLEQAHCLLWVIGLDANGTVPSSDIEFLQQNARNIENLYVIVNKADLRPPSTRVEILEEVKWNLEVAGIEFDGISAYSSESAEEYDFLGCSLREALERWNKSRDSMGQILGELDAVFKMYYEAFEQAIEKRKRMAGYLKGLELSLFELGTFEDEVSTAEFDLGKYTKKPVAKNKPRGSSWMELFPFMAGGGAAGNQAATDKRERKASQDDVGPKGDEQTARSSKICTVREHFDELRKEYSVEQIEKEWVTARGIHQRMKEVLAGRYSRSVSA